MFDLIRSYLNQLVIDAAHAMNEDFEKYKFPYGDCRYALRLLEAGSAGSDWLVDGAATMLGVEPVEIYQELLDKADRYAAALAWVKQEEQRRKREARHGINSIPGKSKRNPE